MTEFKDVISEEAERRSLSPKRRRFIRNYIVDPTNATRAAIAAGYSPTSARVTASRLLKNPAIQGELSRHFIDKEGLISDILNAALLKLKETLKSEDTRDMLRAVKLAIEYTKLASGVLGLNVKAKGPEVDLTEGLTAEELIRIHEAELTRLRGLMVDRASIGTVEPEGETRTGEVLQ